MAKREKKKKTEEIAETEVEAEETAETTVEAEETAETTVEAKETAETTVEAEEAEAEEAEEAEETAAEADLPQPEDEFAEVSGELEEMAAAEGWEDREEEAPSEVAKARKKRWRNVLVVVALAVVGYLCVGWYYESHYLPNTVIDEVDATGLTVEMLQEALAEQWNEYELTLVERTGDTETIAGADVNLRVVYDDTLDIVLQEQKAFLWPGAFFTTCHYDSGIAAEWEEELLTEVMSGLICMDESQMIEPGNATVVYSAEEDALVIADAEYGTTILPDALTQAVEEALRSLADTLDLEESGCYEKPKITEDMPELIAACEEMNGMIDVNITYDMLDIGEVPITKEQMSTWVAVNDSLVVSYDWKAIEAFVADFAAQYDTRDKEHTLKTTWGSTVTITNIAYGWQLDQESEVEALLEDLRVGEDVTREPVWTYTANSHGENDYGDTYVEANLSAQHLYFYKNGELVIESDFVSGSIAGGHATHTGIFDIDYKQMHAVLRGPGYATPVTYWMPFNGGEGLHDATWRNRFGGTIYQTDGSHGCLNLPYSVAQTIYENIEVGDCVIVY